MHPGRRALPVSIVPGRRALLVSMRFVGVSIKTRMSLLPEKRNRLRCHETILTTTSYETPSLKD